MNKTELFMFGNPPAHYAVEYDKGICLEIFAIEDDLAFLGSNCWKVELNRWYTYNTKGKKVYTDWRMEIHYSTGYEQTIDLQEQDYKKLLKLLRSDKVPKVKIFSKDDVTYDKHTFYLSFLIGEVNGVTVYHLEEPYSSDVTNDFAKNQYPPHAKFSPPELYIDTEFDMWALEFDTADLGGYDAERVVLYFETEKDVLNFLKGESK